MASIAPSLERGLRLPRTPRLTRRWPLSGVILLAAALLLIIIAGITTAASAGAVQRAASPDILFAAYADLMPGQPLSALEAHICGPTYMAAHTNYPPVMSYCQIIPKDGPIQIVGVYGQGNSIASLSFRIDGLRAGDLIEQWGQPSHLNVYRQFYAMNWGDQIYVTGKINGRYSLWSEAYFVLLTSHYSPPEDGE